jgi:hypothetical protein
LYHQWHIFNVYGTGLFCIFISLKEKHIPSLMAAKDHSKPLLDGNASGGDKPIPKLV